MEIEILTICDAATDSGGKLNVLGAFDSILAKAVPVVHPQCAVALRIRFSRVEEGEHEVRVSFIDADGRPVMPPLTARVNIAFRGSESSLAANMVLNLQRLSLKAAGDYLVDVSVDGKHERSVPLCVRVRPPEAPPAP